jgi:hypothetical protein
VDESCGVPLDLGLGSEEYSERHILHLFTDCMAVPLRIVYVYIIKIIDKLFLTFVVYQVGRETKFFPQSNPRAVREAIITMLNGNTLMILIPSMAVKLSFNVMK